MEPLVLVTTASCPACKQLSALLTAHDVDFVKLDVDDDPSVFRLVYDLSGAASLPQVFDANDAHLGDLTAVSRWLKKRRPGETPTRQSVSGKLLLLAASLSMQQPGSSVPEPEPESESEPEPAAPVLSPPTPPTARLRPPSPQRSSSSSATSSAASSSSMSSSVDEDWTSALDGAKSGAAGGGMSLVLLSKICRALLHGPYKMHRRLRWFNGSLHRNLFGLARLRRSIDKIGWLDAAAWPAAAVAAALYRHGYVESAYDTTSGGAPKGPFRLVASQHRYALNYLHRFAGPARPAPVVAHELNVLFLQLCDKFVSADGLDVDYWAIANSDDFDVFAEQVHELQAVELDQLSPAQLKAFFLNLYNALVIHSKIATSNPKSAFERSSFFNSRAYWIAGARWTLDDIEHGALRANRRLPGFFTSYQFSSDDARLRYCLPPDPRVHFALVCGAKSCPPLRSFRDADLDHSLDIVTRSFVEQSVVVDHAARTVTLSLLFKWYKSDFGATDQEVIAWIAAFYPPLAADHVATYAVHYSAYDWTSNGKFTDRHQQPDQ